MTVDQLAYSLLGVSLAAGLLAVFASRVQTAKDAGELSSYLLAGGSLGRISVLSLLVSSSFGLNSLFYAAWLGYSIGIYALIIHASWSMSFLLLSRYAWRIKEHKSMHHLLGHDFGSATRVVAGLCSLLGMMYFIGWETEIARHTFSDLLNTPTPAGLVSLDAGNIITTGTIIICLLYTVLGGLKGNAWADLLLNIAKLSCVVLTVGTLAIIALRSDDFSLTSALFPSWSTLLVGFGIFGFITNIGFNISWQFVDASSWQSIIAGRQIAPTDAHDNVRSSGLTIFFVPNLIGTLIGIFLHGTEGVTGDNIVGFATKVATSAAPWIPVVAAVMIVACVMSLLDGMFLACAFTLVVDIFFPKRTLDDLEKEPVRAEYILLLVRVGLVGVAAAGAWGVHMLMQAFGVTVFDFVYIMVITQLGLLGPIVIALRGRRRPRLAMWIPIVASIACGFTFAWLGTHGWNSHWADAAATITAGLSIVLAIAFSSVLPKDETTSSGSPLHDS